MFDLDVAQQCADECAKIVEDRKLDQAESKQNAVNLLAVIPTTLIALCPRVGGAGGKGPVQEGWDMRFVEALLEAFEWQVDKVLQAINIIYILINFTQIARNRAGTDTGRTTGHVPHHPELPLHRAQGGQALLSAESDPAAEGGGCWTTTG
jgi:hypothetical protein